MGEGSDTKNPNGTTRRRAVLWGVATVVVLAVVIFGVSALSSPKRPSSSSDGGITPPTKYTNAADERSTLLYERALAAQASGDTTAAIELAQESVSANAGNEKAKTLLKTLRSITKPTDGQPSPDTPTPGVVPTMARVKDISSLLPVAADGYAFDVPVAEGKDAVVSADPKVGSADASAVTLALFAVHDRGTNEAAKSFVDTVHKRVYSKNRAAVTVLGSPGSFGTDGARLASVAFARGPYAFEIVLTTLTGDPAAVRDAALGLAAAFRLP